MKHALFAAMLVAILIQSITAQTIHLDSISSGGVMRHFTVYVPKNYVTGSALPLIIHLHGYGSNGTLERAYTNYMPVADTAGFLVVYPEGTLDANQKQYWNAGIPVLPATPDDVAFISDLIDALHRIYNINLRHVYASGLSNGGYMCYQLAWKLSNKIAAITSVSGSMAPLEFAKCKPVNEVPVLEIHGTADDVIPYNGAAGVTNIDTLLNFWVLSNHCIPLPGITNLPDISPLDGSTVIHYVWSAELQNTACELYKIIGGAHVDWPGAGIGNNMDFSASPTIWQFFNRYQTSQSSVKEKAAANSIGFYPNPCSATIHISSEVPVNVTIIDIAGRTVLTSEEKDIDVRSLTSGCYQLKFEKDGIVRMEKLIKY